MKMKCNIRGLDCANCATKLERALQEIDGVESLSINFIAEKMTMEYDESKKEEIMKNIEKTIRKVEPEAYLD